MEVPLNHRRLTLPLVYRLGKKKVLVVEALERVRLSIILMIRA